MHQAVLLSDAARESAQARRARSRLTHLFPPPPLFVFRFSQPLAPGQKRVAEAWEMPYYATAAATALVLAGFAYRRNVNPHDWARDEAEERMRRCVV
jgi:hypothetical protein